MKKLLVYALFLGFALGSTSCGKSKMATINEFVATYFPQEEVLALIKDGLDYDVTLTDYTQIGFDGNLFGRLKWDEVDCTHTNFTSVPDVLVPAEIAAYVGRIHDTQSIVKIARDGRNWDITLSNGIEVEFNKNFHVIDFDD